MKRWRGPMLKIRNTWFLWIFPLFAVLLSGWLLYDYYREKGMVIRILFEDAAGIQTERTTIRFRGVPIGKVREVYISDDRKNVVAEVILRKGAEQFAVSGSKFVLVTPKIGLQGVSGLETVFEGSYISVLPGSGETRTEFKAQENIASVDPLDDTKPYIVKAKNVESIDVGDPITYRGMKVGSVTRMDLDPDSRRVNMQINVETKFSRIMRANTMIWVKPGVHAKLSLFGGSEITVNSMESIMRGGLEVATPSPAGKLAKAMHAYNLRDNPPEGFTAWSPQLSFQNREGEPVPKPPTPEQKLNKEAFY